MSETVIAGITAVLLAITQFVVLLLALMLVFWCAAGFRVRRAINYATPVFVAVESLMDRYSVALKWGVLILIGLSIAQGLDLSAITFSVPALESQAGRWGLGLFGIWAMLFLADVLKYGGFPPAVSAELRSDTILKFQWMALLMGVGLIFLSTAASPLVFWSFVILTGLFYFGFVFHYSYRLASVAFWHALPVTVEAPATLPADAPIRFVHLTDLHITKECEPRNEPEPPGNWRLKALDQELPSRPISWLLITGDLADHGREDEWQESRKLLQALQTARPGLRVVVAPGNHDLATAYNSADAFFAISIARRQRRSQPHSDGTYLRRYLQFASDLEPQLRTCTGERVKDVLAAKAAACERLIAGWELLQQGGAPAQAACEQLAQEAVAAFPTTSKDGWAIEFARKPLRPIRAHFEEILVSLLWRSDWFAHFPLSLCDRETGEAVVILNSNAPDPTLFGSAWGQVGTEQLTRLGELLGKLEVPTIYLLCHHAPFRWVDSRPPASFGAVRDWATSAVLANEIASLRTAVRNAHAAGKEILFLCGHRHGGEGKQTLLGSWDGGRVVEGASFAEAATRLAAGWERTPIRLGLLEGSGRA